MKEICPLVKSAFLRFAQSTPAVVGEQAADKFAAVLSSAACESAEHLPLYRSLRQQGLSMQEAKHALGLYLQLAQTAAEDLLRRLEPKPQRGPKRLRNSSSEDEDKTKKKRK